MGGARARIGERTGIACPAAARALLHRRVSLALAAQHEVAQDGVGRDVIDTRAFEPLVVDLDGEGVAPRRPFERAVARRRRGTAAGALLPDPDSRTADRHPRVVDGATGDDTAGQERAGA